MRIGLIILIILALIFFISGGYFLGKQQGSDSTQKTQQKTSNKTDKAPSIAEETIETEGMGIGSKDIQDILASSFKSKNYGDIKAYLSNKVIVTKYATGCCGEKSQEQVIDFIASSASAGSNWSFDDTNQDIAKIKSEVEFKNSIVGVSAQNGPVLIFKLDDNNSNNKIISVTYYQNIKSITGE